MNYQQKYEKDLKLGLTNEKDFIKLLEKNNLNFENLKEKIISEGLWNQIIYNKFK